MPHLLRLALAALLAALLFAATSAGGAARAQEAPPPAEEEAGVDELVVQATRSGRRVGDEPVRVEVINREEIEEKILMVPGNISMIVAETGGLRVQVTSPALGSANVRVRGLDGRYTQLLADGLSLYGGQTASLGLLQIPPTDLGQVEVIKGAASALYGPSALGGVINLVSRRPGEAPAAELLANATTRDGQDLTAYAEAPLGVGLAGSLTAGAHRQSRRDLDGDGWIDMPGYERFSLRPRLFWSRDDGAEAYLTLGALTEDRVGGTLPGRTVPDGAPFPQTQDTRRFDGGLTGALPLDGLGVLHLRAAASRQAHDHRFGAVLEDDRHSTLFGEVSLAVGAGSATTGLVGLAYQRDAFRSDPFPAQDYRFSAPGLFAQLESDLTPDLTLAASARLDLHSDYGTRLSPRVSALYRPGRWTVRASAGRGFFAPTPFVDEIEAAGLSRLEPVAGLEAETADTASLDIGYALGGLELNASAFASRVDDAVDLQTVAPDRVRLVNVPGPSRTYGAELLARRRWGELTVTASYVHLHATEPDPDRPGRRRTPRTPHHTAGVVAIYEVEDRGRLGFEAYYTGKQRLDDNPYRTTSRPYLELGILGEVVVGKARLFLNLENLLDVRQTKYDPLLRPTRAPDGRWTVDVWAPTDGFVANAGVRLRFGGGE